MLFSILPFSRFASPFEGYPAVAKTIQAETATVAAELVDGDAGEESGLSRLRPETGATTRQPSWSPSYSIRAGPYISSLIS